MIGNNEDYQGNKNEVEVQVTLAGGVVLYGTVVYYGQRTFGQYLNAGPDFLEFIKIDGTSMWLARGSIHQIMEFSIPKADQLENAATDRKNFDPYKVLGIDDTASYRDVHAAYVRLAKAYHPDRFSSVGLPDEMLFYVQDMSKRINAAYSELEHTLKTGRRKNSAASTQPQPA